MHSDKHGLFVIGRVGYNESNQLYKGDHNIKDKVKQGAPSLPSFPLSVDSLFITTY